MMIGRGTIGSGWSILAAVVLIAGLVVGGLVRKEAEPPQVEPPAIEAVPAGMAEGLEGDPATLPIGSCGEGCTHQ